MQKILAFGASNSPASINKRLAIFAANQLKNVEVTVLDLNDFELPIYSPVIEKTAGIPANAQSFSKYIQNADGVIVSLAEHNGLHTAAFKNLWDWMSRLGTQNIWNDTPMFLLATSPSRRPESNVMKVSKFLFPHFGAKIISSFSLPSFNHFFKDDKIVDPEAQAEFQVQLNQFQSFINKL
ncbi:NAD(P)H-dependent FMN reductase [Marivirga sericea]|uniref:NAD(P)H-dependent FMN reductase n=1 Tax=Marivirga sericea TaxID=1028 RepID=A0A1X7L3F9_9BACT|nr:NAD(P)H-dependent oxidoreductase [Marivirga sericea]SMG48014.1 NAD(P)H-dependent FMN reductase [Marivirga sericea]